MNKHRILRKSKKVQGRGFFTDGKEATPIIESKEFISEKLNQIFSKNKHGAGLKIFKTK